MVSISISLAEDKVQRLRQKADHLGLKFEDFLSASLEDLADLPDPDFDAIVERVLKKNSELYRRLA